MSTADQINQINEKNRQTANQINQQADDQTKQIGGRNQQAVEQINKIIGVKPNQTYYEGNMEINTVPAYNVNKQFHPKKNEWVGYLLELEGVIYYIAGDTDITEENRKVKCDVAFVPVGGTFTMDYKEAAELINEIKPKIAVPTHYGSIVGEKEDSANFSRLVNSDTKCETLMKS